MTATHQYRTTKVEAFNLQLLDSDSTISIPKWVLTAVTTATLKQIEDSQFIVKKPDGSFGYYSALEFVNEFEQLPGEKK